MKKLYAKMLIHKILIFVTCLNVFFTQFFFFDYSSHLSYSTLFQQLRIFSVLTNFRVHPLIYRKTAKQKYKITIRKYYLSAENNDSFIPCFSWKKKYIYKKNLFFKMRGKIEENKILSSFALFYINGSFRFFFLFFYRVYIYFLFLSSPYLYMLPFLH